MEIFFPNKKTHRKCNRKIGRFTSKKAFIKGLSIEDWKKLIGERHPGMWFQDNDYRSFFPTKAGWEAFVTFTRLLHEAEPFASRSTPDETFLASKQAFESMLSENLIPETLEELASFFPDSFQSALTIRAERVFSKLHGLKIGVDNFIRVGHCWLGNFDLVSFEPISETDRKFKETSLEAISKVYKHDSLVIAASCNLGTSGRVKEESAFQHELALSILCVMINLSFQDTFNRLWQIRLMDRPEFGLSAQLSFSLTVNQGSAENRQLGISQQFAKQLFEIDNPLLDRWHESYGLSALNLVVTDSRYRNTQLANCLVKAILYFRQAANQSTPEMQLSILWVCVESFFTQTREKVLEQNLVGLLFTTVSSLNPKYWPSGAKTQENLISTFKKYYDYRSRTLHQGSRGKVSPKDIQAFSLIVSCLILDVAELIQQGMQTPINLVEVAQKYVGNIAKNVSLTSLGDTDDRTRTGGREDQGDPV